MLVNVKKVRLKDVNLQDKLDQNDEFIVVDCKNVITREEYERNKEMFLEVEEKRSAKGVF